MRNRDSWFLKAAQAGIPAAQYLVGCRSMVECRGGDESAQGGFVAGDGGQGRQAAARTMLASYLLARERDPASREQGLAWLERAARHNHREGKFLFAALLATWPEPARRDPARALKLLDQVGDVFDYDPTRSKSALPRTRHWENSKTHRDRRRARSKPRKRLDWDTAAQESRLAAVRAEAAVQWCTGRVLKPASRRLRRGSASRSWTCCAASRCSACFS